MTHTFTINRALIGTLLKRMATRQLKIYVVAALVVIIPNLAFPNPHQMAKSTGIAVFGVIAVLALTLFYAYRRMRKMYDRYEVSLDDDGIELKAPNVFYQRVEWSNSQYRIKKNGDIKVYNKNVAAISRWWAGSGVILIPREINDREQLVTLLDKYVYQRQA